MMQFVLLDSRKPVFIAPEDVSTVMPLPMSLEDASKDNPNDFPTVVTMKSGEKICVCGSAELIGVKMQIAILEARKPTA